MNTQNSMQRGNAPAAAPIDIEAAADARAVLDQMYSYFNWDDVAFSESSCEQQEYALVA